MKQQYPRIGVTSGMRGFFAVMYDEEGPINTGFSSYRDSKGACVDARMWARAAGLPLDERCKDASKEETK